MKMNNQKHYYTTREYSVLAPKNTKRKQQISSNHTQNKRQNTKPVKTRFISFKLILLVLMLIIIGTFIAYVQGAGALVVVLVILLKLISEVIKPLKDNFKKK